MTTTNTILQKKLDRAQHARQRILAVLLRDPRAYGKLQHDYDLVNRYIDGLLLIRAALAKRNEYRNEAVNS
jgi:hypothetical protein